MQGPVNKAAAHQQCDFQVQLVSSVKIEKDFEKENQYIVAVL